MVSALQTRRFLEAVVITAALLACASGCKRSKSNGGNGISSGNSLQTIVDSVLRAEIKGKSDTIAFNDSIFAAFASIATVGSNELKACEGLRYDYSRGCFIEDDELPDNIGFPSLTLETAFNLLQALDMGYSLSSRIPTNHGKLDWDPDSRDDHILTFESSNGTDSISFEQGYLFSSPYVGKYLRRNTLGIEEELPELTQFEWLCLYNSLAAGNFGNCSKEACQGVGGLLRRNVIEGTGVLYSHSRVDVAGKPAFGTAVELEDGSVVYQTSFVGFFPYETPIYTMMVTVLVKSDGSVLRWRSSLVQKIFNGILDEMETIKPISR